jgi:hypothetical protein
MWTMTWLNVNLTFECFSVDFIHRADSSPVISSHKYSSSHNCPHQILFMYCLVILNYVNKNVVIGTVRNPYGFQNRKSFLPFKTVNFFAYGFEKFFIRLQNRKFQNRKNFSLRFYGFVNCKRKFLA